MCKILLSDFAGALTVQACSMKWLHHGPADKESKICCFWFWTMFYSPNEYCPSDYKNFVIQPTLSSTDEILNIAGKCCTCGESERSPVNARLQGASAENLLENKYHIINNATKTPLIKYITAEQRPRTKKEKELVLQRH